MDSEITVYGGWPHCFGLRAKQIMVTEVCSSEAAPIVAAWREKGKGEEDSKDKIYPSVVHPPITHFRQLDFTS
jgi:hypothetical protein